MAISGVVGVAKPDPVIFRIVLRELALEPEQVWHIGDDPFLRLFLGSSH
jgi:FMN phosphatase YigB (HAD superfamily)